MNTQIRTAHSENRVQVKKSKRCRWPGLSVSGIRRWLIFHPLAVALAILMALPVLSWQQQSNQEGVHLFQAAAQDTLVCPPKPANLIIQNTCPPGNQSPFLASDLKDLESAAVNAYLGLHGLPATDASVIYAYGRQGLRDQIRASMIAQMLTIIKKPASERTPHEQTLFSWLQLLVQQNEIALYTNAIAESGRFFVDPCTFTLDSDIASAYNLRYNGLPFCGGQSTIFTPPVPAASYFTAWGFKKSYGAAAEQFKEFGTLMADTSLSLGAQAGISVGAGALVAGIAGAAIYANLAAALAAFTGTTVVVGPASAATAVGTVNLIAGQTVSLIGIGSAVAGPVAIILVAVTVGVAAGLQLGTNIERENDIANFSNLLTQAQNNLPDLAAMVADTSGLGNYKIQATMNSQTVPDVPSATVLPEHRPGTDPNFEIFASSGTEKSISDILTYQNWEGNHRTAKTWGGWFLKTCTAVNEPCLEGEGINADIRYVDAAGVKWTASRLGNNFVHTKAKADSTDLICVADTTTGLTPVGTDLTKCSTYVSDHITLKDASGNVVTAKLDVLTPPGVSGSTILAFGPGIPSNQTITVTGNPAPVVCLSSGSLPADFSLNGGTCGAGTFQIQFNGNPSAETHTYRLELSASDSKGTISIPVIVDVSPQLAIISPPSLSGRAGIPVTFTVTATGVPTPALSPTPNLSLLGLTFKDNGDGTATISGVVPFPSASVCLGPPCGIQAKSSQGTIVQDFSLNFTPAPEATLIPPAEANFYAGTTNLRVLQSKGAITPVSWGYIPDPNAPWLNLKDNGDGTAFLTGDPPVGTSGTFNPKIAPLADGTITLLNPFPVKVENTPVFTSPNAATFTVGKDGVFGIKASQGNITLIGSLPQGLTFIPNLPGGVPAVIFGTPAKRTGGQYTFDLLAIAPEGLTTQELTLNINEAPTFTSVAGQMTTPPSALTVGVPPGGTFAVTTTGFPFMSSAPLPASFGPLPQFSTYGEKWMSFYLLRLPPGFEASNRNAEGFATGTLTIKAPPDAPVGNEYGATGIFADTGVQPQAEQDIFIKIVRPTEQAP